jgi:hypothetical protein
MISFMNFFHWHSVFFVIGLDVFCVAVRWLFGILRGLFGWALAGDVEKG